MRVSMMSAVTITVRMAAHPGSRRLRPGVLYVDRIADLSGQQLVAASHQNLQPDDRQQQKAAGPHG